MNTGAAHAAGAQPLEASRGSSRPQQTMKKLVAGWRQSRKERTMSQKIVIDLSPRKCPRCGAKHRTDKAEIKCYYPNAREIYLHGEILSAVVADIYTHYDVRRGTDTFNVFLGIFNSRRAAEEFIRERLEAGNEPKSFYYRETRIVRFGKFIPGASRWDDAPSRKAN